MKLSKIVRPFLFSLTELQKWIWSSCQGDDGAIEACCELPAQIFQEAEGFSNREAVVAHTHIGYTLWGGEADQVREDKFSKQTGSFCIHHSKKQAPTCTCVVLQRKRTKRVFFTFCEHLLYVELLALNRAPVRKANQWLANGSELLLPLLQLSVVFKVSRCWQGESIPDPHYKCKQDQRHDPQAPWRTHSLHEDKSKMRWPKIVLLKNTYKGIFTQQFWNKACFVRVYRNDWYCVLVCGAV